MFKTIGRSLTDLSMDLRERQDWEVGTLKALDHLLNASTFSFDPVTSILAIGTFDGIIRIFGAPGVETSLSLASPTPVKFLQFATNLFKLACIDGNNKLYLWDLTPYGQIKLETSMRFDRPVTCLALSPSHTHAFIGLESGEIKSYDLLCRRVSTYVIPNAWEVYEKKLITSGMYVDAEPTSGIPVDVIVHPRHLNFVFIAYGGGVVLFDLNEQKTLGTYELLVPAGAPGGSGYTDPDLLKHRRPNVSSLCVHPAGHFFAVGHVDGSIAFWAVEDDTQPLMARTLDEVDVLKVDGEKLEQYLSDEDGPPRHTSKPHEPREPIFKLAWSGYPNSYDPRGGETSLTILGGQFNRDPPGINVLWLPAFNPPAPPSVSNDQSLHLFFRDAMRESLTPLSAYFYPTPGLTQDFLLMPRDSPHFGGTWNPTAILMLFEGGEETRALEAQQFPPLEFLAKSHECLAQDLATALQSMTVNEEPKKLLLPPSLWTGPEAIVDADLFSLDRIAYETLSRSGEPRSDDLLLEGGISTPDEEIVTAIKHAKFEPHRIIITRNADLSIRFLDVSVQLLIPSSSSPSRSPEIVAHGLASTAGQARIDDVQLATESLEVALVLSGGEVLLYRMTDRQGAVARGLPDKQLVSLEHVPVAEGLRFKPYFLIKAEGPVTAFSISDVGFAAVAYTNGSLSVIDMRDPRVMLRATKAPQSAYRHSFMHRNSSGTDPVSSLAWAISGVKSDATPRIRLVAVRASGHIHVYTLAREGDGTWLIPSAPSEAEGVLAPLAHGTFVLDAHTGAPCRADKAHLAVALEFKASKDTSEEGVRCLLLVVGARAVRCLADFGDDRIAKTEWGSKAGSAVGAQVVDRNGSYALAVFTDKCEVLVYSLPGAGIPAYTAIACCLVDYHALALLLWTIRATSSRSVPLHDIAHTPALRAASPTPSQTSAAAVSILSSKAASTAPSITTADSMPLSPVKLRLDSLFNIRRGYHVPLVSLTERKDGAQPTAPPAPAPVGLGPADWRSWLGGLVGSKVVTGDQIDALLAGPDRPVPEKPEPRVAQGGYAEWKAGSSKTGELATSTARTKGALYERLHAAVSERGEMLNDLETSVNSLEQGSKNMLAQG
ncbi:lethal giant larvae like, C-terminal-domain-containing protein [Lactarius sanguifluus]|nr:lethal giant larvae like, C-terminal-domain-containing protein [Lactarius sanguifluus]